MIANEHELEQTLEQLQRMYRVLGDLRRNIYPKSPKMFALMAEGPLDYVRQFQKEIDAFVTAPDPPMGEMRKRQQPGGRDESKASMIGLLIDEAIKLARDLGRAQSSKVMRGLQTARKEVERVPS